MFFFEGLDETYKITDKIKSIDETYKITERAQTLGSQIGAQAQALDAKYVLQFSAMDGIYVKKSVFLALKVELYEITNIP